MVDYREAHRDIVLGVPAAYGYTTDPGVVGNRELADFLSYRHAHGLLHRTWASFRCTSAILSVLERHSALSGG